ncbi:MAG: bifunctional folylpolyglutamate synthase/dihydrofolate synthase [Ruminococcus sp.]|nr:bifunctional folylpolyglutamate synthase/dihydrofolate synthase [Ruminococcus sp.]
MKYSEAMTYIESLQAYGCVPGLANIRRLCDRLGNPQEKLCFVHIAGTNGKGSVLAYVSTILQTAGYKVGRYISPTICDYRERFQINGKMISKPAFGKYLEQVREAAEEMKAEGFSQPTPFEIETAVAFLYFLDKKCDIVILETGMGGTYDATNVIPAPLCAVFTSISMDHMAYLGDSLEKIAEQKAGIIKNGCYVISCGQKEEALRVIRQRAGTHKCVFLPADIGKASRIRYGIKKQSFCYGGYQNLVITMAGQYQIENAVLAVETIQALCRKGFPVTEEQLREGLLQTKWPGRFTIIGQKPLFIIDGAHNEDAAGRLAQSVRCYFADKRIIFILGVLRDKEYDKILALSAPLAAHIITMTPPQRTRALSGYELAEAARVYHQSVTVADSMQEAVEIAYLLAGEDKDTVIIAFGSLTIIGGLIDIVEHRDRIRRDSHGKSEEN